jgi:ribosomal protein L7/L12
MRVEFSVRCQGWRGDKNTRVRIYAEGEFEDEESDLLFEVGLSAIPPTYSRIRISDTLRDNTRERIETDEVYTAEPLGEMQAGWYEERIYFIEMSFNTARYLLSYLPHFIDAWEGQDQSKWGHLARPGHTLKDLLTGHGLTPRSETMDIWIRCDAAGTLALVPTDEYDRWRSEWPENKTEWTVTLKDYGEDKIKVIKAIREVTDLGLREAKEFVESAPSSLLLATMEDAYWTKVTLEYAGATVGIG